MDEYGRGYFNINSLSNGAATSSDNTITIDSSGVGIGFPESELDVLREQVREFYQWLRLEAKEIEEESPDATQNVDAIVDKMEEMFPEIESMPNPHDVDLEGRPEYNTLFGQVTGTPRSIIDHS